MTWEKVACNLCRSQNQQPFLSQVTTWEHPGKFNLVKCQNCGLVFLNPRPTKEEISQFYPGQSYWGYKDIPAQEWSRAIDQRYGRFYREILKYFKMPGRILDVGCGAAGFLKVFRSLGWQVLGTEISREAAAYSEKTYGFKVLVGDLLEIDFGQEKFDVVVFNHALEHLYFPLETLQKSYQILKRGGWLLINIPNIESLGFKIFQKDWYPLQPPRHLHHFSPSLIRQFLDKSGFRIIFLNFNNWGDNYYSFFESFRFKFSPRFKKGKKGGLEKNLPAAYANFFSRWLREIAKIFNFLLASLLADLGVVLKRGETITIYGQKP